MPIDPNTGKPMRGRPSDADREEHPDLFPPKETRSLMSFLPPRPVDPVTGKPRRGRPAKKEELQRLRIAAEARGTCVDPDMDFEDTIMYQMAVILLREKKSVIRRIIDFIRREFFPQPARPDSPPEQTTE
jgi:hypothetical protein